MESKQNVLVRYKPKPKTLAQVMEEIDREKSEGSYFELIPLKYRATVSRIAEENFPIFKNQFREFEIFLNEISRNWLVKCRLFKKEMEARGFDQIDFNYTPEELDKRVIACLTSSASYLLIGPGAYSKGGSGASFGYVRMPLRVESNVGDLVYKEGTTLDDVPQEGSRLIVHNKRGGINTSELMMAYSKKTEKGNPEIIIHETETSIRTGFEQVNNESRSFKIKKEDL